MASPNGGRIYVAEFGQNTVGVVDTSSDLEIAHFESSPLANARTHAVFVTDDGRDLYTTNTRAMRTEIGDVGHIDARTGVRLCNTIVGIDPSEILVTPNGKRGYVSVRGENKVKELDLREDCPVLTGREAVVGTQPDTLQLTRRPANPGRHPARHASADLLARYADVRCAAGQHPQPHDDRPSLALPERQVLVRSRRGPAGLVVVNNDTGAVVADYAYPNPPGGTRAHGVFYIERVLH